MIHWLVQSIKEHPDLARGLPPSGLLNACEAAQLGALVNEVRRRAWRLGRWTSKLLLQAVVRQNCVQTTSGGDLIVGNDPSGAPLATWRSTYAEIPITFSISHTGDRTFCGAVGVIAGGAIPMGVIGADQEELENRPEEFARDYFTETEIALLNRGQPGAWGRDLLVTAAWRGKDPALKALNLGLSVDTRSVTCLIEPVVEPGYSWTQADIQWDVRRLNRCYPAPALEDDPDRLVGWWRILDGYILTLSAHS